jgi:dimethylaniline monooxygenase (N-oxide forming)
VLAYNIYETTPMAEKLHEGTPMEVAEEIFNANCAADGGCETMRPGQPFYNACFSLSREYEGLSGLTNDAIVGRAFQLMDSNGDGLLSRAEFVAGVSSLISPTTDFEKALAARIAAGNVAEMSGDFTHVKKVAIIGAGVAGLQTARALSKIGKEVTIFDKADNVGGVWRANYADFGLQVPKELYEFPDFPYPSDTDWQDFPPGPQVQTYIERYAEEFGLQAMCKFSTGVHAVSPMGDGSRGWQITFGKQDEALQTETFDFCVIATGMYGWPPHLPLARGAKSFKGEILHSCTFTDRTVATGKRVIVVGGGKSAVDNAVSAAKAEGAHSTLLYREAHWPVPRLLANLVPFKFGTYSRFGHFMLPTHYDETSLSRWVHGLLTPVKWGWWRIVEQLFKLQFGLKGDMVPTIPLEIDLFTGGQILNYDFRNFVKEGKLVAMKNSIEKFTETGVVLRDGTELPADMVVYGTGFKKNYDLLDRLLQQKLPMERDGLYLYRNILAPRLPDLAFVGSEVSTFNNILTHSLQAQWLKRVLSGEVQLPTAGLMEKTIEKEQAWKRTWMPGTSARASIWQLHMMKYHDTLCKDMQVPHKRKSNPLAELFMPYQANDYAAIFK